MLDGNGNEKVPAEQWTAESWWNVRTTSSFTKDGPVTLDVGGEIFTTTKKVLAKYPNTRLGKLMRATSLEKILELCDEFTPAERPEYFFDRNPDNFPSILDMYRTGRFHMSEKGCALVQQKDIQYWGVDDLTMEPCCALKYFSEVHTCQNEKEGDIAAKIQETELAELEDFGKSCKGQLRSWIWNTLEYPWTSTLAQAVTFTSLSMVLVSTATFILSTMNELRDEEGLFEYSTITSFIEVIDTFVVIFFTVEYGLRLLVCPSKIKFLKSPMNIVDFIAIVPFYVALVLKELEDFQVIGKAGKIIRLARIMRIIRIFKVVRHVAGLQSLIMTIKQAYEELKLLMVLLAVAILTYTNLVYFAEKDPDLRGINCTSTAKEKEDPCYSWTMVESFWWGLMTFTTVGYDLYPKTMEGKVIGGFCALSGIFILTLPIPIVVNSFVAYYKNRLWRTEVNALKRERIRKNTKERKIIDKLSLLKVIWVSKKYN